MNNQGVKNSLGLKLPTGEGISVVDTKDRICRRQIFNATGAVLAATVILFGVTKSNKDGIKNGQIQAPIVAQVIGKHIYETGTTMFEQGGDLTVINSDEAIGNDKVVWIATSKTKDEALYLQSLSTTDGHIDFNAIQKAVVTHEGRTIGIENKLGQFAVTETTPTAIITSYPATSAGVARFSRLATNMLTQIDAENQPNRRQIDQSLS